MRALALIAAILGSAAAWAAPCSCGQLCPITEPDGGCECVGSYSSPACPGQCFICGVTQDCGPAQNGYCADGLPAYEPDAGAGPDAGSKSDGGAGVDGGSSGTNTRGCGCDGTGAFALWGALLVALAGITRRSARRGSGG